ncbi:MAG: class I SAM-dependent methyltransferase [Clostridia bacterium]|nr:class I SAM-dependent methyltransferase [Clostridia bacterium]
MKRAVFDSVAQEYDAWYETEMGSLVHEIEKEVIFELLKPQKGQRVLDLGCGTGLYSIELAKMGLKVTGIDISEKMISYARKKSENLGLDIRFIVQDAHSLPFEDDTFDRVVSVTALEFFPEPTRALREAYRVLKPGGRMVIGVIGANSPWSARYEKKAKEEEDSVFRHARFYTAEELLSLLPEVEGTAVKALYFPPDRENFDRDKALAMERQGRAQNGDDAGFVAALWIK